jgi:hypothetical protein
MEAVYITCLIESMLGTVFCKFGDVFSEMALRHLLETNPPSPPFN